MAYRILLVSTAALMLAACGGSAENATVANAAGEAGLNAAAAADTENEAAPALENAAAPVTAAAPTASAGAAPTRDFIVGKWGENGDCTLAIEFRADGTMIGPFERWELNGAKLTMVGAPEAMTLSVVDQNTMESRLGTGAPRRITRC